MWSSEFRLVERVDENSQRLASPGDEVGMNVKVEVGGVLETVMYAADLDAIADFYSTVIGLEILSREPGYFVFFRCGPGMLLFFQPEKTLRQNEGEQAVPIPAHGATGPGHVAFRVTEDQLPGWRQRLEANSVEIEYETEWTNGGRSVYFRDPAGNSLELATPRLWGLDDIAA